MTSLRMTTADLDVFPDPLDDTRYEIIDGELYVSQQPSLEHQFASDAACAALRSWSEQTGRGFAFSAPGVIFAQDDNAAPDVVWISKERLREALSDDGKLHKAPELVVEVLSPGAQNEQRDREVKLKLYSRRGVEEYWIVAHLARMVSVYRQDSGILQPVASFSADEDLQSPLLPGFNLPVGRFFFPSVF